MKRNMSLHRIWMSLLSGAAVAGGWGWALPVGSGLAAPELGWAQDANDEEEPTAEESDKKDSGEEVQVEDQPADEARDDGEAEVKPADDAEQEPVEEEAAAEEKSPDNDADSDEAAPEEDEETGSRRTVGPRRSTPVRPGADHRSTSSSRDRPRDRDDNEPEKEPTVIEGDPNFDQSQFEKPAEERTYRFSFENITYEQLLRQWARMTGLAVIGDPPTGPVSYSSSETLDYEAAFRRVRMLLFQHRDNYYMVREDNVFKVKRMTEMTREIVLSLFYKNVEIFQAAQLNDEDVAFVLFTPPSGSVDDLQAIRDFMPDYFRTAPYGTSNTMTIFGLVKDINKYLQLAELFSSVGEDPRMRKTVNVKHITPSRAVELLDELMVDTSESGGGSTRRARGKGGEGGSSGGASTGPLPATLIPFDEHKWILVVAMEKKIQQIEQLLSLIDMPTDPTLKPVVVSLRHTEAEELAETIRPLVEIPGTPTEGGDEKTRRPRGGRHAQNGETHLVADPRTNSLIVFGDEDYLARVETMVKVFDVPSTDLPRQVELQHADAAVVIEAVNALLGKARPGRGGGKGGAEGRFVMTAAPLGNKIVMSGPTEDLDRAEQLIAQMDVEPTGPQPTLHQAKLVNAKAAALAETLNKLDAMEGDSAPGAGGAEGKSPRRGRPTGRSRSGDGGRFFGDEPTNTLFVYCTDEEWDEKYWPQVQEFDSAAERVLNTTLLEVEHISVEEAVSLLEPVLSGGSAGPRRGRQPEGESAVRFIAAPNGVVVLGAEAQELDKLREVLAKVDVDPRDGLNFERKIYELMYLSAEDAQQLITEMLASENAGGGRSASRRRGQREPASAGSVVGSAAEEVRMSVLGANRLVVNATHDKLDEIDQLIASVDVAESVRSELRVFPFAPGVDVDALAEQLGQVFAEGGAGRSRGRGRGEGSGSISAGQVKFLPQSDSHKLVVSAPVEMWEQIESAIEKLTPDAEESQEPVFRTVILKYASADDMAATIKGMVSGASPSPRSRSQGGREAPKRGGASTELGEALDVTLTAGPGGQTLVLRGVEKDVDVVEGWIRQLDDEQSGQYVFKVYFPVLNDPQTLAETIMTFVDTGGGKGGGRAAKKETKKEDDGGLFDDLLGDMGDLFETEPVGPLVGKDIIINADSSGGSMLVKTTPANMKLVDHVYRLYEGTPEEGPDVPPTMPKPLITYDMQFASAYDAAYDVQSKIDKFWNQPERPPTLEVDYDTFTNQLLIRCDEKYHEVVADMVALYVDVPNEEDLLPAKETRQITGIAVAELVKQLQGQVSGIRVEVQTSETRPEDLIEQLVPYDPSKAPAEEAESTEEAGEEAVDSDLVGPLPEGSQVKSSEQLGSGAPAKPTGAAAKSGSGGKSGKSSGSSKGKSGKKKASGVKEARSCVPPASMMAAWLIPAPFDDPDDEDAETEKKSDEADPEAERMMETLFGAQPAQDTSGSATEETTEDEEAESDEGGEDADLILKVDDKTNEVTIEGSKKRVSEITDLIDDILIELEENKTQIKPDIRVLKLRYQDVEWAAQVLEAMFNLKKSTKQSPQQLQQMQQQQQQMMRAMQQTQQQRGRDGQNPQEAVQQAMQQAGQSQAAGAGAGTIHVFPNPKNQTLIIRAATEDYPMILELLATIDRPGDKSYDMRIFPLEKRRADEVETMLNFILGLDKAQQQQRSRSTPTSGMSNNPFLLAQQLQAQMLQLEIEGMESLGLSSSDQIKITSDAGTNSLICRAPKTAMPLIADLIEKIEEQPVPETIIRSYNMMHADAAEIVEQLLQLFPSGGKGSRAPKGAKRTTGGEAAPTVDPGTVNAPTFISDVRGNRVIVKCLDIDVEEIEEQIKLLDIPSPPGMEDVLRVELKWASAESVARALQEAYGARRSGKGGESTSSTVRLIADADSNVILVKAPVRQREEILKQIEAMDTKEGNVPRLLRIEFATPSEVAKIVNEVYGSAGGGRRGGASAGKRGAMTVTGDDESGQVIIVSADDVFEDVKSLVASLDSEELVGRKDAVTTVYSINYADPSGVLAAVTNMNSTPGRSGRGVPAKDRINAVVEPSTQSLVVTATPVQHEKVAKLIADLDTDKGGIVREIYKMKNGDATQVAEVVNQSLKQRGLQKRQPGQQMTVVANESTNSLIIYGTKKDVDAAKELLDAVDLPADQTAGRYPEVYALRYADPGSTIEAIKSAFSVRGGRGGGGAAPSQTVDASYAWGTSSLVVTANKENHEKVKSLLGKIDIESSAKRRVHIIKLKEADASQLSQGFQALYRNIKKQAVGGGEIPLQVYADPGTNSLIVYASDEEMVEISALLATVDVKPEYLADRQIKSFKLDYADSWGVKQMIDETFRSPGGGRGGSSPKDLVTSMADWASNSLVVTASSNNMEQIEKLITEVDQADSGQRPVHVLKVMYADPESVAQSLTQTFAQSGGRGGGRGQATISVINPRGTDSLLVRANEKELADIKDALTQLDVSDTMDVPKIIALTHVLPSQIAPTLTKLYVEGGRSRSGRGASYSPPIIEANDMAKTLLVKASTSDFNSIQELVKQLDVEGAVLSGGVEIVTVEQGVDVEELVMTLEDLLKEAWQNEERQTGIKRQASMAADVRTNSILLAGDSSRFPEIKNAISTLQKMGPIGGKGTRTLRIKNADPEEIKRVLEEMVKQEQSKSGSRRR